jgi:hypothetical protein
MVLLNMEKNRTPYNTTIDKNLLKRLKLLSVEENKRHNDLLEEAIQDLLNKYKKEKSTK